MSSQILKSANGKLHRGWSNAANCNQHMKTAPLTNALTREQEDDFIRVNRHKAHWCEKCFRHTLVRIDAEIEEMER